MSKIAEGLGAITGTLIATILVVVIRLISIAAIPLTFIFLILKLCSIISWGWFYVFIPLIVWGVAMFISFLLAIIVAIVEAQ